MEDDTRASSNMYMDDDSMMDIYTDPRPAEPAW